MVLKNHVNTLDLAAGQGKKDGQFGSRDMEAVVKDSKSRDELRWAAQRVLDDPNFYHALDTNGGRSDGRPDDKFGAQDLDQFIDFQRKHPAGPIAQELAQELQAPSDPKDPNPEQISRSYPGMITTIKSCPARPCGRP
ncbi:MAG: hypothetical protein KF760_33215 [Candidatus Eremiobacteraeota bacterium]|nr:hypothetical protein [Candidatus Eremiobacteraeota bacterium]MCW5869066.1 hypothetical protein [Candidatus Eremiobacteraeota bacterium]